MQKRMQNFTSTAGLHEGLLNSMLHLLCWQFATDQIHQLPTADVTLLCCIHT